MEANDLFRKMDQETADYIVTHYLYLINQKEKLANRHLSSMIKLDLSSSTSNLNSLTDVYRKIGWLTEDEDALALIKLGEEAFRLNLE